jgi:hypothetical protein
MSNTATAPKRAAHGRGTPGRSGPSGRLIVGDYVGASAAHAAQGVRRAGLRPGLDRSFGCDPNLTGLIVAQDPPAGSDLARNGMVTLYVAAPGAVTVEQDSELPGTLLYRAAPASPIAEGASLPQVETPPLGASARRARKPRLGASATAQVFDPPPEPRMPMQQSSSRKEEPVAPGSASSQVPITSEPDTQPHTDAPQRHEFEETAVHETAEHELSHEEFVVHMDDVFAGRVSDAPAWRRVYPRRGKGRTLRRALPWASRHRVLATTTCSMLGVWIAVAVLAGVASRPAHTARANMLSETDSGRSSATTVRRAAPAPPKRTARPATAISTRTQARPRLVAEPRRERAKPTLLAATPLRGSVKPASSASPSPATAIRTPAPAPQQTGGGPFSP